MVQRKEGISSTTSNVHLLRHQRCAMLRESFTKLGCPPGMCIDLYMQGEAFMPVSAIQVLCLSIYYAYAAIMPGLALKAQAEIYTETMRSTLNTSYTSLKEYLTQHPFIIPPGITLATFKYLQHAN